MLSIDQRVKMKNRKMLPEFFENKGKIVRLHDKDKHICWVEFGESGQTYMLNLHEVELEDYDE